jgi:hypothetical protein
VIGDECQRGKPFPDPYLQGLLRLGLQHAPQQVRPACYAQQLHGITLRDTPFVPCNATWSLSHQHALPCSL